MSPRIGADVLLREHETRMHDPRGMSAQSDKNVRWSRHGPPAVHQFCPWGTRESSFWLRPHAGWISRGNCDFVPFGVLSFSLALPLSLSLSSVGSAARCRLTTTETQRIMKFGVTKDSREISCESGWKLSSIHRDRFCKRAIDVYVSTLMLIFIVSPEELGWNLETWYDLINRSWELIWDSLHHIYNCDLIAEIWWVFLET